MTAPSGSNLADEIGGVLPYLRRYARALTGSRETGDFYAAATLEAILDDNSTFDPALPAKTALFKTFHLIWTSTGAPVDSAAQADETGLAARAHAHLSRLTANTREALLLHTIEEFSYEAIAQILETEPHEAAELVNIAYSEMARERRGRVMIVEDESIIALDLDGIVSQMGHRVTGVARTEAEALKLAQAEDFDLILSDIHLADGSSGIHAALRIQEAYGPRPTIFVTAFPERLLTGEGLEPTFVISKPYTDEQIRSAISQAMFFATGQSLETTPP
ncbi:MAG: response regulator [Pseudomonadota bacterium]